MGVELVFWEDWWIGQKPLKHLFPGLYNLARRKGDSVTKVLSTTPLNISFRRALVGERLSEWLDLVALVVPVTLNENKDKFLWQLRKNGSFSTQTLNRESMKSVRTGGKDPFWKAKLPLKIKIFLWYLKRGVLLTKDNLLKRGWNGEDSCSLCGLKETVQHLFFDCRVARFLWNTLFITFHIRQPKNNVHLFGSWLRSFSPKLRNKILVGLAAMC